MSPKRNRQFGNPPGLPPLCFGVLVSLVYNRGASLTDSTSRPGDRQEMRDIRDAVASRQFDKIPGLLRSMERLWPLGNGLRSRREQEAELFEAGLGCTSPKFCPALKSTACTLSSVAVSAMTGAHVPLHRIMVWPAYPLLAIASKPAFGKSRPPATAGRAEAQESPTPDGSG